MTEFNAACALEGLKILPDVLDQKQGIALQYEAMAKRINAGYQKISSGRYSTRKDFILILGSKQERDALNAHLEAAGIETRIYFTPAYRYLDWHQYLSGPMHTTEKLYEQSLCLPSWVGVEQATIIQEVEKHALGRDRKRDPASTTRAGSFSGR